MYRAIKEDDTQVVQFGYWKSYVSGLKRKILLTEKKRILKIEELYQKEIAGIFGMPNTIFTPSVWTKIYQAEILKQAAASISETFFFAEDCYLNCAAFFSDNIESVSVRPEAYYVWSVGVGFSSSHNSGEILFDELKFLKPLQINLLREHFCNEEIILWCHLEVLYFMKAIIIRMMEEKRDKEVIVRKITELDEYDIVKEAKLYFNNQTVKPVWRELEVMISNLSPIDYYTWCESQVPRWKIKSLIKRIIRICKQL